MPTSRPKLTLDEQSFQDMLAAAFTIQEHNARRKKEVQPPARACGQCGAALSGDSPLCERCASERRPGEELQRKWASLWLMSQEQGLWPDRALAAENDSMAGTQPEEGDADVHAHRFPEPRAFAVPAPMGGVEARDISGNGAGPIAVPASHPVAELLSRPFSGEEDASSLDERAAKAEHAESALNGLRILPDSAEFDADVDVSPSELQDDPAPARFTLRDLRLKLRFHRADFYLVIAIVISTFAMVWVLSATPAPGANHRPRLRLWERALISMGLADLPEAPARHGNPNISVWVDPKTALYYCVGEELYGKAPGGHVATQREAQLDQFEPAGRAVCE